MSETYKFVGDIEELKFFWMYGLRSLEPKECYFLSTSARNKRLNEDERKFYLVGRSEMFCKEIIPEDTYERFLRGIRRCETNKLAYLTKANLSYPSKVLVLYINISPIDAYFAMKEQMKYLMSVQSELTDSILKNSVAGIDSGFKNIRHSHTTGQSVFARSFSDPIWVDIDADVENYKTEAGYKSIDKVKSFLYEEIGKGNFMQIQTVGGWHWLIRKDILKNIGKKYKESPIKVIIDFMLESFKDCMTINEIVQNKNEMIPCPGTFQYGEHLVNIWNKDDFESLTPYHEYPTYEENNEAEI
jgi:hypothetical protein